MAAGPSGAARLLEVDRQESTLNLDHLCVSRDGGKCHHLVLHFRISLHTKDCVKKPYNLMTNCSQSAVRYILISEVLKCREKCVYLNH